MNTASLILPGTPWSTAPLLHRHRPALEPDDLEPHLVNSTDPPLKRPRQGIVIEARTMAGESLLEKAVDPEAEAPVATADGEVRGFRQDEVVVLARPGKGFDRGADAEVGRRKGSRFP